MAKFERNQAPPVYKRYQEYKPYLRLDFLQRCAYCEITEGCWGSERNFAADHFRPKSKFPDLVCDYRNLYYACNRCNEIKGDTWPDTTMRARGHQFVDPCEVDPFQDHLEEREDGTLKSRSRAGAYMIDVLRLNREQLCEWRKARAEVRAQLAELRQLTAHLDELPSLVTAQQAAVVNRLRAGYQKLIDDALVRFGL